MLQVVEDEKQRLLSLMPVTQHVEDISGVVEANAVFHTSVSRFFFALTNRQGRILHRKTFTFLLSYQVSVAPIGRENTFRNGV